MYNYKYVHLHLYCMYVDMYCMYQMFAQSNLERLCMLKSATSTNFCRLKIRGVEESIEESCVPLKVNVWMYAWMCGNICAMNQSYLSAQAVHAAAGRNLQATHLTQTLDEMLHTLPYLQLHV